MTKAVKPQWSGKVTKLSTIDGRGEKEGFMSWLFITSTASDYGFKMVPFHSSPRAQNQERTPLEKPSLIMCLLEVL